MSKFEINVNKKQVNLFFFLIKAVESPKFSKVHFTKQDKK